jgi:radical SAM superfamily enzyme YgiQ (UPF0313 family)
LHASLFETLAAIPIDAEIVGLTGTHDVFAELVWLAKQLRAGGFCGQIVLGHDFASLNDVEILRLVPEIDFIVRGEAEKKFVDLVDRLAGGMDWKATAGVTGQTSAGPHRTPDVLAPLALDELPLPSRDDTADVLSVGLSVGMFTKRGCQYRCSFCTTGHVGRATGMSGRSLWRMKSPGRAADEFLDLARSYQLDHLTIVDDLFVGRDAESVGWAYEFAELLIAAQNRTTFMVDIRADGADRDLLSVLHRAGLRRVFVGAESGSSTGLKIFRKGYRETVPAEAIRTITELDILPIVGFINVNPLDDLDSLIANDKLITSFTDTDYFLYMQEVRVYPGTSLELELRTRHLRRGEFPYYHAEFSDPRLGTVARHLRDLKRAVYAHIGASSHAGRGMHRELFKVIRGGVLDLVEANRDRPDEPRSEQISAQTVQRAIEIMVA